MRVRTIFLIIVVFNCSCSYAGKLCFWKRFPDFHDAKEQRKEELVKGFSLLVRGNPLKVHGCFFLHGSSDFGTRGQGHLYSVTVIYYGMSAVFCPIGKESSSPVLLIPYQSLSGLVL